MLKIFQTLLVILLSHALVSAQDFYFGNDLSYVNQMEDCGAVFKENGQAKNVYQIFADHGTNLVRVRLWVDPSWWQAPLLQPVGVKPYYNDFEDVKETIQKAKNAGMKVMLDLHYSDFWADPARQLIPRKWLDVANNLTALKDSVYNYTVKVLTQLNTAGLMPEFVKVGNENNGGILNHIPTTNGFEVASTVSNNSWARHAQLYNAAIQAVRFVGSTASVNPKIALHFTNALSGQVWNYNNMINNGVTDFDIIGFSYYYAWHQGSIAELENTVKSLKTTFPSYDVMCVETGYLWTTQNFDALGNIINTPDPQYLPVIPEKQLEYMVDFARAVKKGGGNGVIFWESAWVSTPCRTPWGVGSSHDHVVYFDPVNTNFMENGGGKWTESQFYQNIDAKKITFKVDMTGQDVSNGVFITGAFSGEPWKIIKMANEGNNIYSYFTYLPSGSTGAFYFLKDDVWSARETVPAACATWFNTDRGYTVQNKDTTFAFKWGSCAGINSNETLLNVTFKVDMTGVNVNNGVYVTGAFTGTNWQIIPMNSQGNNLYTYTAKVAPNSSGAYYFMNDDMWGVRETVPTACAAWFNTDRGYATKTSDTTFAFKWGTCQAIVENPTAIEDPITKSVKIFPNPTKDTIHIDFGLLKSPSHVELIDLNGKVVKQQNLPKNNQKNTISLQVSNFTKQMYILKIYAKGKTISKKIILE